MAQEKGTLFKAGDVVTLKSGGPDMTVAEYGEFGFPIPKEGYLCVWFEKSVKKEDVFAEPLIKHSNKAVGAVNIDLI